MGLGRASWANHGGFPGASFFVSPKPGWKMGSTFDGPVLSKTKLGGTHGELPDLPDLRAAFFVVGPGVPAGHSLNIIDMRDIAPTLAHAVGLSFPATDDKVLRPSQSPFTFYISEKRELVWYGGVQPWEDARNLTSLRARRRLLQKYAGSRRRKFPTLLNFLWRCVMSVDPESVPRQSLGSLQSCLVEGDPEQRARERRVRRRALISSVLLQASFLAALILVPLLAKPAHLVMAMMTPIPPYRHVAARAENTPRPQPGIRRVCVACPNLRPATLTPTSRPESSQPTDPFANSSADGFPVVPCAGSGCIDVRTEAPRPPVTNETRRDKPKVLHPGHIDPAMLIHRVEPVYPTLPKQLGRSGRVELRAVIATDGSIQSLQVVSGDPLFYQSAMDAVRQWRYRPTVLNGEPVEIDTFISVIYNIGR